MGDNRFFFAFEAIHNQTELTFTQRNDQYKNLPRLFRPTITPPSESYQRQDPIAELQNFVVVYLVHVRLSGARDFRNGIKELMGTNPFAMVPFLPDVLSRPGWLVRFLKDGGVPKLANVVVPGKGAMEMMDVAAALAASAVKWDDLRWIRELWKGPIVVKGVLTGEDARRAVDEGAAAVSVSNHGGRQLDGVRPSIRALPEVVAAVKDQIEVWMDGGVRRGSDIVKALCLGARAVLCGRAYAYALSAAGEAGVSRALQILRTDVDRTVRLLGCASVSALDRSYVELPAGWE